MDALGSTCSLLALRPELLIEMETAVMGIVFLINQLVVMENKRGRLLLPDLLGMSYHDKEKGGENCPPPVKGLP